MMILVLNHSPLCTIFAIVQFPGSTKILIIHGSLAISMVTKIRNLVVKFIYSEKATKFCEISTLLLTTVHTVKSKVEISQNFVAFSEHMNFNSMVHTGYSLPEALILASSNAKYDDSLFIELQI